MSTRWLFLVLGTVLLFVLMPFLFWQSTWFGRPLPDEQIAKYLADHEHPRKAQHALSQIADRMLSRNTAIRESARRWYPQVVELASSSVPELRLTSAWVMGQDNTVPEFHRALHELLSDADPMVQRNAALSLVRFGDATGRQVIQEMLAPYPLRAPQAGVLLQRLKPDDPINPGTLLGRIQNGKDETEIRSQVPGRLERWVVANGAAVSAGTEIALLDPSPEMVWEGLRALHLIGLPEDLPIVERYARGVAGMPETVRRQAELTARSIRSRPR